MFLIFQLSQTQYELHSMSKLLQESSLTVRQPHKAPHHAIQATACEVLVQGPYVAARVGIEPATLWTEGTEPYH